MIASTDLAPIVRGTASVVYLPRETVFRREQTAVLMADWMAVAIRTHCRTLVIDCSRSRTISSAAFSMLVVLQGRLQQRHCRLKLRGVGAALRELLGWTKLVRIFEIQDDAELAPVGAG